MSDSLPCAWNQKHTKGKNERFLLLNTTKLVLAFIFSGHSTRECTSVAGGNEQGFFFFLFHRPTQEPALATPNARKSGERMWNK